MPAYCISNKSINRHSYHSLMLDDVFLLSCRLLKPSYHSQSTYQLWTKVMMMINDVQLSREWFLLWLSLEQHQSGSWLSASEKPHLWGDSMFTVGSWHHTHQCACTYKHSLHLNYDPSPSLSPFGFLQPFFTRHLPKHIGHQSHVCSNVAWISPCNIWTWLCLWIPNSLAS